jgi:hypothetical protein
VGVRLGRAHEWKGRALPVIVKLRKARKRANRPRIESNTTPLIIERSLFQISASFLPIIRARNKIKE